jgi:hypothetical protein
MSDARAVQVLVNHQRLDAGSCVCGWSKLGASHCEHQWRMLKLAALKAGSVTYLVTVGDSDDSQRDNPLT